jgi:sigma-B regulation protein RsbU (phosphoserine phosphatase)
MNNKGISYRLNSTITSIAIIIIAILGFINLRFSDQLLRSKIEEGAIHQSNLVISKISRITIGTEEITRNTAYQALYFYQHHDVDKLLNQVLSTSKFLEGINIELLDNDQHDVLKFSAIRNNDSICQPGLAVDEDYIHKLKAGNIVPEAGQWSNPYFCHNDTANPYVSYRFPIHRPGSKDIAGIVSAEISLRKIRQMLSEIKLGEEGFSYIIDRSGLFITHPSDKYILKRNFFKQSSPLKNANLKDYEFQIRSGRRGVGSGISEYLNYRKCWFFYAPLSNSNWTVIIVIPEQELFRERNVYLYKIITVSVIGIILLFLLNMIMFKRVLDPLARVTNAIHGFTSVPGKGRKAKNEIVLLAQSLEDWQAKYGRLMKEKMTTAKEKQKFEKDLKSAQEIQQNIIPSGYPAFKDHPEIDIFAILKPAETIGGDLYDYYFIDKEHLLIAIGDVSGKGIPASLFMAIASTLIKNNSTVLSSHEIVENVNNELGDRNPNQYFLTLFIGVLNITTGVMDYCNAAHNYPYILHADGTIRTLSKSHGIPLGIYRNKMYKSNTIELSKGDLMVLYTDGIINSSDKNGTFYGTEKLNDSLLTMNDLTSKEVVNRLMASIKNHEAEHPQSDDISIVALRYLS